MARRAGSAPEEGTVADIDVVKGRSSNNWIWWVVAAVVVALLVMFLMRRNDTNAPARSPSSSMAPSAAVSTLVA
jgi:bacteriorhodopsin